MKNPTAIITAMLLLFTLTWTAFTQQPTKPPTQQPPIQQPKQNPTKPKPTEPEEQDQVLKLTTQQVTVPVIITDGYGNFITGLKKNDFQLREDGAAQEIEQFDDDRSPFSVALLVDLSLSTRNKLEDIKRTAIEFVKQLQPRDKVLVVDRKSVV